MFGLILGGLAALTAAASAVAWICDELTKEQRQRQDDLRRENGEARRRYGRASNAFDEYKTQKEREYALERKALFAQQGSIYLSETSVLEEDLTTLLSNLDQQLSQPHLSPYRRNALKLLLNRVEDAKNRLIAYQSYCRWYLGQLDYMVERDKFGDIIDFDYPEAKLPEDWFYVGKVGLVARPELNGGKNRFYQTLQLEQVKDINGFNSDPIQQMLAQIYPDQDAIPIQITKANKSGLFFSACVKRGSIHVDHILERVPCKAVVERDHKGKEPSYLVSIFPSFFNVPWKTLPQGGISALLSRSETLYPSKNYQAGDQLEVFPFQYDLLLTNHRERDPRIITVTERESSLDFEQVSAAPVYLCIDLIILELPSLEKELEGDAQWQLQDCYEVDSGGLHINFQLGGWTVQTTSCATQNYLTVIALTPADPYAMERTTIPIELQLIEKPLLDDVFLDEQQLRELQSFCLQQSSYEQRSDERNLAWQFFSRWNKVADYLLETDGFICVEFSPLKEITDQGLLCSCDADAEQQMKVLLEQTKKESDRRGRLRLPLEQAYIDSSGAELWLKIADLESLPSKSNGHYVLDCSIEKGIANTSRVGFIPVLPQKMRLRVRKSGDHSSLLRQKQAVESFVLDKLLNKSLKQILIDPASHQAQPVSHWQQKIDAGLTWKNEKWHDAEKGQSSKRVIESALLEPNLYLIQGPPGTGKTTCIVELLHQLYEDNPSLRILVASQQNAAVDNALTRFIKESPQLAENILRVGANNKIDEALSDYASQQRLQVYFNDRVLAYQKAAASSEPSHALLKDWIDSIRDNDGIFDVELSEILIGEYKLVGATCVGLAGQHHGLHRLKFDIAIIDEAGRSTVPELLIPILRSRKVILIGDHFQLPPSIAATLREKDSLEELPFLQETFLKESFFEVLFHGLPNICRGRLTEQYRMADPIGDLVAKLFYQEDGKRGLFNGEKHETEAEKERERGNFLDADCCLRWKDVRGEQEDDGKSKYNEAEAFAICDYLAKARDELDDRKIHKEVAVITPYGAQKKKLRQVVKTIANDDSTDSNELKIGRYLKVRIDTVDSFQGSEADIVLYSTVRTKGCISFIQDRQRLNVACSRAKENLIFFGDAKFLQKAEQHSLYAGDVKFFTEIILNSVLSEVPFIVTIYKIPKQDSLYIFAQRGSIQYFIYFGVAINISKKNWCSLKEGDQVSIVASDDEVSNKKAIRAVSVELVKTVAISR